ncbi:MAG: 50S ribosomal protein L3 [Deltaproteobacteria bacterium]|nr:50S ribosomal protein L3 [Deltaproteobacteria bacterium]
MNEHFGLIGKKLGNTQIFNEDGSVTGVTAIEVGPCIVLAKRTADKHGYTAIQLGFGEKRDKLVTKPEGGYFKKLGVEKTPRVVREFRVTTETADKYEVGQVLGAADLFEEGQKVDITGVSKGRGFAGVIKRHNMHGAGTVGHGTHEAKRHGGSIGMNMTPGRVFKGVKMPGRYGGKRNTVMSVKVAKILPEDSLVLVAGSVPGSKNSVVTVRKAIKNKARAQA